jgi:ParB family chromosome partitioning protein
MNNTKTEALQDAPESAATPETTVARTELIELDRIDPNPFQPRKTFSGEELDKLVASILENGLIHPPLVRPMAGTNQRYELVAGERRLRALRKIRFQKGEPTQVLCTVRDVSDVQSLELALEENAKRHDINPIEEASGYAMLENMGRTQEQIAKRFGITAQIVSNRVRLLSLPDSVQRTIADGELTHSYGVVLLALQCGAPGTHKAEIEEFAERAAKSRWTVAELTAEIDAFLAEEKEKNSPSLPMADADHSISVGKLSRHPDSFPADSSKNKEDAPEAGSTPEAESTPETTPDSNNEKSTTPVSKAKKEPFAVGDQVQWNAGGKRAKWQTGAVAEVGRSLVWVQPDGTTEISKRKSFQKKNCILHLWDGKSAPGKDLPIAAPVEVAKETVPEKTKAEAAKEPAGSTPVTAPTRKVPAWTRQPRGARYGLRSKICPRIPSRNTGSISAIRATAGR